MQRLIYFSLLLVYSVFPLIGLFNVSQLGQVISNHFYLNYNEMILSNIIFILILSLYVLLAFIFIGKNTEWSREEVHPDKVKIMLRRIFLWKR